MNIVKRYNNGSKHEAHGGHHPFLEEREDGYLVLYSDHIAMVRQLEADKAGLVEDNSELRVLLACCYSNGQLYSDDGELQDTREPPFIDFKRDSLNTIKAAMSARVRRAIKKRDEAKPSPTTGA